MEQLQIHSLTATSETPEHFADVGKMVELDLVSQCQIDNIITIQKVIVIEKGRWF